MQAYPILVRLTATVLVALSCVVLAEGFASFIYASRDSLMTSPVAASLFLDKNALDPYEEAAEGLGLHWRLRAGYTADQETHTALKLAEGKLFGLSVAEGDAGALHVNSAGFRGPELDAGLRCCRLLMLGDSVTFGLLGASYPAAVGERIREQGFQVETVNGGVEGYTVENLALEMDRFIAVNAKTVTVMIGWNNLFKEELFVDADGYSSKLLWLLRAALRGAVLLMSDPQSRSRSLFDRPKTLDKSLVGVGGLENIGQGVISKLSVLVERLQDAGQRVAIITLPGLFLVDEVPDARALSIGHLPTYTDNPYFFAAITAKYNAELRKFAEARGVMLIDAAIWSRQALLPRSKFFLDSVHLTAEGLRLLGAFIAAEIVKYGAVPDS